MPPTHTHTPQIIKVSIKSKADTMCQTLEGAAVMNRSTDWRSD